jgi:hypothetical protein
LVNTQRKEKLKNIRLTLNPEYKPPRQSAGNFLEKMKLLMDQIAILGFHRHNLTTMRFHMHLAPPLETEAAKK